jgi:hypothetical protein
MFTRCARTRVEARVFARAARVCSTLAAIAAVFVSINAAVAQERRMAIRGYEFDPLAVERAGIDGVPGLRIDERLRAPARGNAEPQWRLLQFDRPLDRETRNALRSRGLQLDLYVSGAYIERISLDEIARIRADPTLRDILRASIPYHPAFKLSPSIGQIEFRTDQRRAIDGLLLRARPFRGTNLASLGEEIRAAGGMEVLIRDDRESDGAGQITFRLERGADLSSVARIEGLRSIEEVGEIVSDNVPTAHINQSGDATQGTIWAENLRGENQIIGIIDNGPPDPLHCFFAGPGKVLEVRNATGKPPSQHATAAGGSAAGDSDSLPGLHAQRGGAWAARLVFGNHCDFFEGCSGWPNAPSSLLAELEASRSKGANVHSNSWHDRFPGYSILAADFDDFTWTHEDQLILGSSGQLDTEWAAPAISKNAIAVSAAKATDPPQYGQGSLWAVPSGRVKPDLAAFGCGVRSAALTVGTNTCGVTPTDPNHCSTSHATPHAAAIAVLARQYFIEGRYPPGSGEQATTVPSAALLKATLINSARDILGSPGFGTVKEGWGVVTLDRTLAFENGARRIFFRDVRNTDSNALQNGSTPHVYDLSVTNHQEPLKVTLVWTDYPSEPDAGALINDLNLQVTAPNGTTTYLGNDFTYMTPASTTGGTADATNNVEQVLVESPPIGQWQLTVLPADIANLGFGDSARPGQGYALVATAGAGAGEPAAPEPPTGVTLQ